MSSVTLPKRRDAAERPNRPGEERAPADTDSIVREFAQAMSSLKTTVWLFALTIFLIFAGTLAQTEREIWQVVHEYFRSFLVWIDFQILVPRSLFPHRPQINGGFYFPGGWSLGVLLAVNLLAAHGLRFRPQARGWRLLIGVAVITAGVFVTWLVIASGSTSDGLQSVPWVSWTALWRLYLSGLAGLVGALLFLAVKIDRQSRRERGIIILAAILLGLFVGWLVIQGDEGRLDDSSMRILWQLTKGSLAGLVLLAGCAIVFRKRGGIVLVHVGVALLMLSELLVGMTAVEAKMHLAEGQSVNFVEDSRSLELAVVDRSAKDADDVVVVPQSLVLSGETIRHPDLPFDVRIDAFFKNSALRPVQPGALNPATDGLGLQWMADEARPVSGTDTSGKVDQPAAYVTFLDKSNSASLGTRLVSLVQSVQELPEKVLVGKTPYRVYLRFQRTYKPYEVELIDVRKDDYVGTNTPRNYSSQARLIDAANGVDRTVRIWMNNPLRYAGETFYQSGYFRDSETGVESTTFQVVSNTGWMIPYVACMLVATGLLAHFSIVLFRFLRRRERNAMEDGGVVDTADSRLVGWRGSASTWKSCVLPAGLILLLGTWTATKARPPVEPADQFSLYDVGKLPVVFQGRI
ncbi:MAG: cytochrome c biogenesis protein ResB, partial [Planctomycetaceae bacterium]